MSVELHELMASLNDILFLNDEKVVKCFCCSRKEKDGGTSSSPSRQRRRGMSTSDSDSGHFDLANLKNALLSSIKKSKGKKKYTPAIERESPFIARSKSESPVKNEPLQLPDIQSTAIDNLSFSRDTGSINSERSDPLSPPAHGIPPPTAQSTPLALRNSDEDKLCCQDFKKHLQVSCEKENLHSPSSLLSLSSPSKSRLCTENDKKPLPVKSKKKKKWRRIVVADSSSSSSSSSSLSSSASCSDVESNKGLENQSNNCSQSLKKESSIEEQSSFGLKTREDDDGDDEEDEEGDFFVDDNDLNEISSSILLEESLIDIKLPTSDENSGEGENSSDEDSSDEEWQKGLNRAKLIFSATKNKSANEIRAGESSGRAIASEKKSSKSLFKSAKKADCILQKLGITFSLDQPPPKCLLVSTRNKHLNSLFQSANDALFDGKLGSVTVSWSGRLTSSAGIFHGKRDGSMTHINLSYKLLSRQPSINMIETLLHEMIHAYLFVTGRRDKSSHGPNFRRKMSEINYITGFNVTITHSYHEAVKALQTYVWRCDGVCRSQAAFNYGFVKRSVNRAPSSKDIFYSRHARLCDGQFKQITAGQEYEFAISSIR